MSITVDIPVRGVKAPAHGDHPDPHLMDEETAIPQSDWMEEAEPTYVTDTTPRSPLHDPATVEALVNRVSERLIARVLSRMDTLLAAYMVEAKTASSEQRELRAPTEHPSPHPVTPPTAPASATAQLAAALIAHGGAYRTDDVARVLGVSRQALHKQRAARRILALRIGARRFLYPVFQFEGLFGGQGRVHPWIATVLAEGAFLTPAELFLTMATPQPLLGGAAGWALLTTTGGADHAVALVRDFLRHLRGGAPGTDSPDVLQDLPTSDDWTPMPELEEMPGVVGPVIAENSLSGISQQSARDVPDGERSGNVVLAGTQRADVPQWKARPRRKKALNRFFHQKAGAHEVIIAVPRKRKASTDLRLTADE